MKYFSKFDNILQDWKTEYKTVTKVKIKRAGSANLNGNAMNELYRRLIVKCFEIGNFSYRQPLPPMLKK